MKGTKVGVGTGGEGLSSASGLYPPFSGSCLYAGSNVKLVKVLEQGVTFGEWDIHGAPRPVKTMDPGLFTLPVKHCQQDNPRLSHQAGKWSRKWWSWRQGRDRWQEKGPSASPSPPCPSEAQVLHPQPTEHPSEASVCLLSWLHPRYCESTLCMVSQGKR